MNTRRTFLLLYAASGAAALVYEVTWTRLLTQQLGHTVAAASAVLAAFMGGLAIGSWWAGARPPRDGATALRAYAALEGVAAAAAILLPFALRVSLPALAWAYADGAAPIRFNILRVVISLLLVGVPATAMGATFPIAAGWLARSAAARSRRAAASRAEIRDVGLVYALNTAGAAVGAIAAGFWLIPGLGLRGTTLIGVLLNAIAAVGALWLASRSRTIAAEPAEHAGKNKTPRVPRIPRLSSPWPMRRLGTIAAALTGFVALVYEVAWTRLLALVLAPTTYAFATVVASFVVGIAIGSALGARIAERAAARDPWRPALWLGVMLVVAGIAASAAAWFAASRLPLVVAAEVAGPDASFDRVVVREAFGVGLLLLPLTMALGAAFPLALAAARQGDGEARDVGRDAADVYTSNTVGAIAGALCGGFALVPLVGLQATTRGVSILAAASGAACIAAALLAGSRPGVNRRVLLPAFAAVAAVAAILSLPPWDLDLLASGAYKYSPYIQPQDLETELRTWRLLYYKDGAVATVGVRELAGMRSLAIDGKVDASNMGDMLTQRLLGLLPVLLHDDPREICVIGLGSGVTVASALASGAVRRADVVEISPEVVSASRFFDRENGRVLDAPAVHLVVGDGRSHLLLTTRRYDVIVSEPSNPWMAGIAALYTREFFDAVRARLTPDGIVCQWAHTYDISADDLRSIVRTFASAFPQSTMWLVGEGDLLLIGTNGPAIEPHVDGLARRWRRRAAPGLLGDVGMTDRDAPFAMLSMLVGGPDEMQRYGGDAPIQRDDRTALEFSAPRAIYGRPSAANAATIRMLTGEAIVAAAARGSIAAVTDESWTVAGAAELKADASEIAYDRFQRALRLNGRNADALAGLIDAATGAGRLDEACRWLDSLARAQPDNVAVRLQLSRAYAATGNMERAADAAAEAMRLAPDDPRPGEQLGSVLADAGDAARLAALAEAMIARFPGREKPRYYRANARVLTGHSREALDELRQLVGRHPDDVRAQNLLGVACAGLGLRDCAQSAFEAALGANARDPSTYVNLGVFRLQVGDPQAAASYFAVALTLDRSSSAARQGLTEARAAMAGRETRR